MNSLTWFLYIADVLYKQLAFAWFLFLCVPIVYLLLRLFKKIWAENTYSWELKEVREKKHAVQVQPFIHTYKPFIFSAVGIFFVNLIPSQDTFYLMAASEAGEMVVRTPEAQEIMSDLKQILKVQLEKLKGQ